MATSQRYRFKVPRAQGYLIVDSKWCSGCQSCMMACSLVHEGEVNLSLARIQVMVNTLENWPNDVKIAQCRQCVYPTCLAACPNGALYVDTANGNIRVIDSSGCTGCQACIKACCHPPHRIAWNHQTKKALKCDLCIDTPYWGEKGGVDGKQACVEACKVKAIKFVRKVPDQTDDVGYDVCLRPEILPEYGKY